MFTELITMLNDFDKDRKDLFDLPDYVVEDKDDAKILTVLLPGFDKSEIKVSEIENGVHVVTSKKTETSLIKNVDIDFEISGNFKNISAKYENGVLQVLLEESTSQERSVNIE